MKANNNLNSNNLYFLRSLEHLLEQHEGGYTSACTCSLYNHAIFIHSLMGTKSKLIGMDDNTGRIHICFHNPIKFAVLTRLFKLGMMDNTCNVRPFQHRNCAAQSPDWYTSLPLGDGCTVARQYSRAVALFAQSPDDVTPLSAI